VLQTLPKGLMQGLVPAFVKAEATRLNEQLLKKTEIVW
jgi:hypothetical protein